MLTSFRVTFLVVALSIAALRCYPVQLPQYANFQDPQQLPKDAPPPNPGQVVRPWQPGDPGQPGSDGLHIVVIDGEDGVNIIKKKTAVKPVVEVRDKNNLPVGGVVVIFSSPSDGPSVTFINGSRSISVVTDASGRATTDTMKPLNEGKFQINVQASYQSQTASTVISMTNLLKVVAGGSAPASAGASAGGGISGMTIGIIVGVAAAAAIGIGVGLSHHGGAAAASSTTATIGVGSGGSVGAPH
jgi:hypothetical protein